MENYNNTAKITLPYNEYKRLTDLVERRTIRIQFDRNYPDFLNHYELKNEGDLESVKKIVDSLNFYLKKLAEGFLTDEVLRLRLEVQSLKDERKPLFTKFLNFFTK